MFLSVENLKKLFGNNLILNNINFNCYKEDITIITGESGSGKSTLLKCLNGLLPIDEGGIFFKDKAIYEFEPLILRKNICYISQIPVSICNSVIDEFKFVKKDISSDFLEQTLESFKLHKNILNKNMKNLSIGQQQRIAILRGILNEPEIMLLDEPTSALDEDNIKLLKNIILNLNKDKNVTFIIVTHNINFAENITDKIFKLANGELNVA